VSETAHLHRGSDGSPVAAPPRRRLISVITPVFNEEENVAACVAAVQQVFAELPEYEFEHVFCDNASTDGTVKLLKEIAVQDPRVKLIVNARNFGPFCSTFNALLAAQGDAVLVMLAADLQDPPEVIPQFLKHWESGYEVAYGIRANREEGLVMRTVRKLYYRLVSYCAGIHIPLDVGEFQLIDRAVVEALRKCDDYYPYIRGMIASCGFRSVGVPYTWRTRRRGFSKNRLYHLVDQGLNGLISFTNIPMRLCLFLGFGLAILSFTVATVNVILNLIFYRQFAPPGVPTLIVSIFFFTGVQLFFFGVLGEYISAIHFQVRKRPLVVERERINLPPPSPA
jgi:glycosyltransferase involved in cell wall biosynthesis